ncbi:type IV pilus secretin PilQ [Granulosicoccus antarcticus]|uniref:type IV pilus secretin PilQ n=1 Tax=Granulosicoccus antarcticus TaxID=437505 RepID=UPI001F1CAACF|nr:type IV pilus secretin PilQ [Granulosicoccus antarcticus]
MKTQVRENTHRPSLGRTCLCARGIARAAALALLAGAAFASQHLHAAGNSLIDISHVTLPGNKQQLALTLSGPAQVPKAFTIDNPARIALDLADTSNELDDRRIAISSGMLQNVTTVEAGGRTRVVINLTALSPYTTSVKGNQLLVTLDSSGSPAGATELELAAANGVEEPALIQASGPIKARVNTIDALDFRRGPMGEGRVIFNLSSAGIVTDMRQEGGRLVVEFPDTQLADKLQKRLDVMDFGTPVQFIDAISNKRGTKVIIQPATQEFEQLAYQTDDMFTVELKPMSRDEIEENRKAKFGYIGEQLSLNFQDIEVRSVLQLLADFTDLNIVVSDSVQGKLTLRLKNVPWDQALDIILQTKALGKRQAGNVIMIAPAEEIATRERIELEGLKQKTELAPLRTEFFQANYAKASELATLLQSKDGGMMTERGSVSVDDRTNTLLINDTVDQLESIRALVHRLDVPIRQVLIESRIVIASDDFNKDIGVRWGLNRNTTSANDTGFALSGNANGVQDLINGDGLDDNRFNVNLPGSNAAGSLGVALAKLPFGTLLELELSAMQAEGNGEVISSPRVITANQHEAYIEQGVEIPYLEASSSGATSVSFRKAVLGLTVTPQITPDDRIVMDLKVNKDTVGEIFGAGTLQVPSIDTREVSTQVLVDNGETVVLGGVYEQTVINKVDMVPFFGNLPLIGRLFQHTTNQDDKSELLIFVTPKIIKENVSLSY